jgi:hypothetical protein
MSKEMEPKVSINDLKKIRSFSRQRNMVCLEEMKENKSFSRIDFINRMSLKHYLVQLLHPSMVMNI